jgi:hypothetical protein
MNDGDFIDRLFSQNEIHSVLEAQCLHGSQYISFLQQQQGCHEVCFGML